MPEDDRFGTIGMDDDDQLEDGEQEEPSIAKTEAEKFDEKMQKRGVIYISRVSSPSPSSSSLQRYHHLTEWFGTISALAETRWMTDPPVHAAPQNQELLLSVWQDRQSIPDPRRCASKHQAPTQQRAA